MFENRKKCIVSCVLIAMLTIIAVGCGSSEGKYPKLEGEEARTVFDRSSDIKITGDIDDINTSSDVIADSQNVGKVKEHGIVNSQITYSVDGEDQFYVAFCDFDEEDNVVNSDEYATSTTYTYYDMDGYRLGYAQDRALFQGDDEWYVMVFLDTDGYMKNYYIEANDSWGHDWAQSGAGVYNMNREKVGEISLELTNALTRNFSIEMDLGDAADELSEMDRVAIYWRCVSEMNKRYNE